MIPTCVRISMSDRNAGHPPAATIRCDPATFQRRSGAQRNFKSLRQNREGD
jgi:hypothetical protein